jgi:hypothetical protein
MMRALGNARAMGNGSALDGASVVCDASASRKYVGRKTRRRPQGAPPSVSLTERLT